MSPENIEKIRCLCAKSGCRTDKAIAKKLGLSASSFSRKLNGHKKFSTSEIESFVNVFGLPVSSIGSIFFTI